MLLIRVKLSSILLNKVSGSNFVIEINVIKRRNFIKRDHSSFLARLSIDKVIEHFIPIT